MKKIGLLSDTHNHVHERLYLFFEKVDEIWHAGDFGSIAIADQLASFKKLRGVYGNIDGHDLRASYPLHQRFLCEEVDVWMTHIGGYPGRYDPKIKASIMTNPPKLFITGHSHILKIVFDKKLDLLHINPGAAGIHGFQKKSTAVRFDIDGMDIINLEVWEMPKSINLHSQE